MNYKKKYEKYKFKYLQMKNMNGGATNNDITLVDFDKSDEEALLRIEAVPKGQLQFVSPSEKIIRRLRNNEFSIYKTIKLNGTPIGMISTVIKDVLDYKKVHLIKNFVVDHRYQGNGFGRISLQLFLDILHSNDIFEVFISSKNIPALKFYERMGFQLLNGPIEIANEANSVDEIAIEHNERFSDDAEKTAASKEMYMNKTLV